MSPQYEITLKFKRKNNSYACYGAIIFSYVSVNKIHWQSNMACLRAHK